MKRAKRAAAVLLSLAMIAALGACGMFGGKKMSVDGTYKAFAIEIEGYLTECAALNLDATMTLDKDGTGTMTTNGQESPITSWTEESGNITVNSGGDMTGTVKNGVMILDFTDFTTYYAKEDADISGFDILTTEEFDNSGGRAAVLLKYGKDAWYGFSEGGYNRKEAEDYFQKAADAGSADAWYYIAKTYENSDIEGKYGKIEEALKKGLDIGSALCAYGLGRYYELGPGTDPDYDKALTYYKQAVDMNLEEANAGLGRLYRDGSGVEQSSTKALEYFEKALNGKEFGIVSSAMKDIGFLYGDEESGIGKDPAKELEWVQKAADDGSDMGYNSLGVLYENGEAVEQDYAKALEYYQKAADLGNASAMKNIGLLYEQGLGVEADVQTAMDWYFKALNAGNRMALRKVALYYDGYEALNPDKKEVDRVKAADYFRRAALENRDGTDYYNYGLVLYNGDAGEENKEEAFNWFKKGAEENDGWSMYLVARYYNQGTPPVSEDKAQAKSWYEKALATGNLSEEQAEYAKQQIAEIG